MSHSLMVLGQNQALFQPYRQHSEIEQFIFVSTVTDVESRISTVKPDLLIVDIDHELSERLGFLSRLTLVYPDLLLMVLSSHYDRENIMLATGSGVRGFLLVSDYSNFVFRAIKQMFSLGSYVHPKLAPIFLQLLQDTVINKKTPMCLTPRECDVLECIGKGGTCVEIADALNISSHTVTSHMKSLYRKLSIHSKSEAMVEAIKLGLVRVA